MAEKPHPARVLRAAEIAAHEKTLSHPWNPRSEIKGVVLGRACGLERTGVSLARLAPGKESFPFHSHHWEEEWLLILSGTAEIEAGEEHFTLGSGDFMAFPTPSVAHLLRNAGEGELVYLMGGERRPFEVADFPRLGKRMVRSGDASVVYPLEGEDPPFPGMKKL